MTLRHLSFLSWPFWAKFTLGFFVAILLPVIFIGAALMSSVEHVGRLNAESTVFQIGTRSQEIILAAISTARVGVQSFIVGRENERLIELLQASNDNDVLSPIDRAQMITNLRNDLLNVNTGLFNRVELLDVRGRMIVQAEPGLSNTLSPIEDRSTTSAYGAALNANNEGQNQVVAVSRDGNILTVEVIGLVEGGTSQNTLGYVVGRLNVQRAVYDNLVTPINPLAARTYLVTSFGALVTSGGVQAGSASESQRILVQKALNGERGAEGFTNGAEEGIRYFEAVSDTDLVIISEILVNNIANQVLSQAAVPLFVIVIGVVFLIAILSLLANQLITPPLARLRKAIQAMGTGNFDVPVPDVTRGDEIGALAGSFADMRESIQVLVNDLEARVDARARDAGISQEISRFVAAQRDAQHLMDRVVNLIIEHFPNIYHAQIFLVDGERRYAVLRASTGEAGRKLLERGHRLGVGSVSVVGQATDQGDVIIARDVTSSQVHRRNELLPDTLAEMALPLRFGHTVIGALDVQSRASDAFGADQVALLQSLADQIAIAIENARLYQASVQGLQEVERSRRAAALQNWRSFLTRARTLQSESGLRPANYDFAALRQSAFKQRAPEIGAVTERQTIPFAVPIHLRDQILGTVAWEVPVQHFDNNQVLLAQELTNRLAVSLENARLFEQSQRAAERERLVNDIAAKLTSQNEIDQILQTAVREVGQALRSPQVTIRLRPGIAADESGPNGNGHA